MSDSSYVAVTRHRKPHSTAGRSPVLDVVDDAWAADKLSDDEIDAERQEAALAPLLDEGDLDVDAVVVSTGHSGSAANGAAERRRREEGRWNDLGLDHFDTNNSSSTNSVQRHGETPAGSG
mmetsp:Transcript_70/g.72  ORF Transcript_70/g.72 Transcript_70/m.72 type:complete len:121 (-) Transcript_70:504-866(-)|eukprot:CAMPEP_0197825116 /NCGR_PEP_ID=MMETSP1437-20131217/2253_1 /TAXON_ID=49252 ORGANISM="Eucampia antarctica, Strain CCMP1452" /NCGR_SAMPLE_ID=MMETSP1437 /ASSEMBLY_ACC=CAM_ASM_001096 /LENGTH=120 /DNA_ID=CAMNT_0043424987 /DNA_START=110 /DNA_END=472 /DNA_ORIENTATION=+